MDAADLLNEAAAAHGFLAPQSVSSEAAFVRAGEDIDRRGRGDITGLLWPSEWPTLEKRLGPLEPASLTIIAARPAVGKSIFGLQLARDLAAKGKRVQFVSRELSVVRLMRRNLAAYGANMLHLRLGMLDAADHEAISSYAKDSKDWELFYDEHSKTVEEVRTEAGLLTPDCIIIDYLQRLAYDTEKEYAAITRIVNELQDLTLETGVPVVCLSQLSRPLKGFEWRAPTMSDTRGSGAVEERAANLILLHRHWETKDEEQGGRTVKVCKTQSDKGAFIIAKCSDGEPGPPIGVRFIGARMRVEELQ
jgi:replicative DNA helicase